ncbi:uncharacterized protein TA21060 [Theileria annulata]|uniref:Uncharacterized protein n=1 Tax=Theileria annulata TaxID=5874 RepID=Q4UGU4_THEAN|nr:uncharacterized protein TA21060 [Theileria annulata]CAI73695.1 hypothetical protein TA21060 [Theileria annulata]|eukprot:XP_954372.1 hypothetical protein TA21060 [Theileria annulata]
MEMSMIRDNSLKVKKSAGYSTLNLIKKWLKQINDIIDKKSESTPYTTPSEDMITPVLTDSTQFLFNFESYIYFKFFKTFFTYLFD